MGLLDGARGSVLAAVLGADGGPCAVGSVLGWTPCPAPVTVVVAWLA
jgi:hypothetical protein